MAKVNTTIRLDLDLKNEASKIAQQLGTNLSTVISLYLKNNFIVKKWFHAELRDEYGFTPEAAADLQRELDETDKGIGVSKSYDDVHSLISDLRNDAVKY